MVFVFAEYEAMDKIFRYIKNGEGIGAKYLLVYALIVAITYGAAFKVLGNMATPSLQNITDQLFPIKIENGVIVEPANTIKDIKLDIEGYDIPFILDTRIDTVDTNGLKSGIYISRKSVYAVDKDQVRVHNFKSDMYLPKDDYTGIFKSYATGIALVFAVMVFVSFYVMYLALCCFYAFFANIIAKHVRVNMDYAASMRLSTVTYIFTSIVFAILNVLRLSTNSLVFFVAMIALQIIVLKNMKEKSKNKRSINKI